MQHERARALRKTISDAERRLWSALRGRQLHGLRFRRQHPIGPYIADFICLEKRLVVEVDGSQHAEPAQIAHDTRRTNWLQREGYRVLRVWTNEVFENLDGVAKTILVEADGMPSVRKRSPPPSRAK